MDWNSLIGLAVAILGIIFGQAIEGGHIGSLVQPAAFIIVLCGTFGAVILQTSPKHFAAGIKMLSQVFTMQADDRQALAHRINGWSTYARKEGLFMLESYMQKESDPFIKKGLQLMIDGTPPEKIREIVAIDMHFHEIDLRNSAKILSLIHIFARPSLRRSNKNKWACHLYYWFQPQSGLRWLNSYADQCHIFVYFHTMSYQILKLFALQILLEVQHELKTFFR